MADIFLSYARKDRAKVARLVKALEGAGYSIWWDRHIDGGSEFSADIERELGAADAVVVAWSKDSVASHWVRDEAGMALAAGKLVAISLDGTAPPIGFKQIHAIDMSGADSEEILQRSLAGKLGKQAFADLPGAKEAGRRVTAWPIALGLALLAGAAWWIFQDSPRIPEIAEQATTQSNSVAVLPFTALSAGDDDMYFADGLTEEIMTSLGTLPNLRVTARSSVFFFKDKNVPLADVAERLGVEHIVEGTVRRSGDRLRITAELVRASDGVRMWSDAYDAAPDDVVSVQVDIAEQVAAALDILLNDEKRALMAEAGTENVEAYRHYAKGMELFRLAHGGAPQIEALQGANAEFERAIALSPDMWAAHFASADLYSHTMLDLGGEGDVAHPALFAEAPRRHDEVLRAAARYAPDELSRILIEQARLVFSNNWTGLAELSDRALQGGESCAFDQWLHFTTIPFGQAEVALDFYRRLAACSPIDESSWQHAQMATIWSGKPEIGLELNDRSRIVSDATDRGTIARSEILLALGRFDEARLLMQPLAESADPISGNRAIEMIGSTYAAQGNREKLAEADALLRRGLGGSDGEGANLLLSLAARGGNRGEANRLAGLIDTRMRGSVELLAATHFCFCGAPFDLEATPNFARRLRQSGLSWPPSSPVDWPLKNW